MKKSIFILLIVCICGLILAGCSSAGSGTPTTPNELSRMPISQTTHHTWGLWQFIADPVNETLDIIQLRTGNIHLNALPFLEPPALTLLTLDSLEFNGDEIYAVIGLRHPFLGLNEFTGFDVCGILITNGSVTGFDDPGLRMAGESDTHLMNPDGYMRWWNPAEFPINNGTIFSYTDGLLGAPDWYADYNSTLNAYKFFCDDLTGPEAELNSVDPSSRCVFSAGQKNSRMYRIKLGDDGLIFNYAVDANWQFPEGDPPWQVPDDFPPLANRPEAWNISVEVTENTLYNDGAGELGGDLSLMIDVYDHFNADLNTLKVESPGNFQPVSSATPVSGGEWYSTYEVDIISATPGEESIELLITIDSELAGYQGLLPGVTQAAYFTHTVPVSDESPVIPDDPGWREFRHDVVRSGRTEIEGPLTDNVAYSYQVPTGSNGIYGGIVFDSQNRALFRSNDGYVYCVDSSGTLAWSYNVGGTYDYCTPLVDENDGVYVTNSWSQIYYFDSNGQLQWSKNYSLGWIIAVAVQDDGTMVFCAGTVADEGVLVKTNSSGDVDWVYDTLNTIPGAPAIGEDGTIYCANHDGKMYAVNQEGGEEWVTQCGADEISATPALGPLGIYISDWGGYVYCLDYDGGIEWSTYLSSSSISGCVAIGDDGYVYIGSRDDRLYCLDAANGNIEWSFLTGGDIGTMSPVLDGADRVYVGSYNGHFYCLTTAGTLIWDHDCGVPGPNAMYCKSPAIADDGTVAVGSNDGILFAFKD